jgi:regulator of replication initiation timing
MDYSDVSQTAKRFEQKSKVNHKIEEIKQKMMEVLRENSMSNVENYPLFIFNVLIGKIRK